jgi:cytochrome P450
MAGRFGNNSSIFTTSSHDLHRLRRAPLNSLFSKRSIVNFQPVIREKIEILMTNIAKFGANGAVVDMKKAWSAFAGDVVCQYAFGYTYDHLQSEGFNEGFHDAFMAASEFGLLAMQLPWLDRVSGDAIKIGEDWKC